ncbi:MAG: hypothetical protein IJX98_05980, partial [Clostridia bacterium]|nr:hypothetical protein [Clostridia bacterium]
KNQAVIDKKLSITTKILTLHNAKRCNSRKQSFAHAFFIVRDLSFSSPRSRPSPSSTIRFRAFRQIDNFLSIKFYQYLYYNRIFSKIKRLLIKNYQ